MTAIRRTALAFAAAALALGGMAPAFASDADAGAAADAQAATPPPQPPDADAPTVAAHADKTEAHVGDPIQLSVVAIAKTGVPVNLPATLTLEPFTLLERKEAPERNLGDGRVRREFTLSVAAYEP